MTRYEIAEYANEIIAYMGGDAEEICNGSCPKFAKLLGDAVGRGEIVGNLASNMKDEIEGYEVIEPEIYFGNPNDWRSSTSHCWVKIDGRFYDAFNPEGVDSEDELQFYIENVY
jgi:hypothetical protein